MSKRSIVLLTIVLTLVALIAVAARLTGALPSPWREESLETVLTTDPADITEVDIRLGSLDVRIYASWDETLDADAAGAAARQLAVTREGGVVTIREAETSRFSWLLRRESGYLVLWLPAEFRGDLLAVTGSGDVSVSGLDLPASAFTVGTGSGEVSVYDTRARALSVTSSSGDLFLGDTAAEDGVYAAASSGDVYLTGVDAPGGLSVVTASGDVSLTLPGPEEDYSVDIVTASGSVYGAGARTGGSRALRVETASGDIWLTFE